MKFETPLAFLSPMPVRRRPVIVAESPIAETSSVPLRLVVVAILLKLIILRFAEEGVHLQTLKPLTYNLLNKTIDDDLMCLKNLFRVD